VSAAKDNREPSKQSKQSTPEQGQGKEWAEWQRVLANGAKEVAEGLADMEAM
jgi:hypothetical protein